MFSIIPTGPPNSQEQVFGTERSGLGNLCFMNTVQLTERNIDFAFDIKNYIKLIIFSSASEWLLIDFFKMQMRGVSHIFQFIFTFSKTVDILRFLPIQKLYVTINTY